MASLSLTQAGNLIREPLKKGVVKEIITVDKFFEQIPFTLSPGRVFYWNRELAESAADVIAVDGSVPSGQGTVTQINVPLKRIIGDVHVDRLEQLTMSRDNDQLQTQIALKSKAIGRKFKSLLIKGSVSGNANEFDGLDTLILANSGQVVSGGGTAGQAVSFKLLDEVLALVTSRDDQIDFLVSNERTRRSTRVLLRAQGGSPADEVVRDAFGNVLSDLAYRGIPWYRNDNVSITIAGGGGPATKTRVYTGVFGEGDGFTTLMPETVDDFVQVEAVGMHPTRDTDIVRVRVLTSLVQFSTKSGAVLSNLND